MWRGRSSCLCTRHLRRASSVGKSAFFHRRLRSSCSPPRAPPPAAAGKGLEVPERLLKPPRQRRAWAETGWGRGRVCGGQNRQSLRGGQNRQSLRGRKRYSCCDRRRSRQSQSHLPRRRESEPSWQRRVVDGASRPAVWACPGQNKRKVSVHQSSPDTPQQLRCLRGVWCAAVKDVNDCPVVVYGERSVLQFF